MDPSSQSSFGSANTRIKHLTNETNINPSDVGTQTYTGTVGKRVAEKMPPPEKRVNSECKVWTGIKLITALTCKNVFGLNPKILTTVFVAGMVLLAKEWKSFGVKQGFNKIERLLAIAKFFEFAINKEELKRRSRRIPRNFSYL